MRREGGEGRPKSGKGEISSSSAAAVLASIEDPQHADGQEGEDEDEFTVSDARGVYTSLTNRPVLEPSASPQAATLTSVITGINRLYPYLSLPSSDSLTLADVSNLLTEYKCLARGVEALLGERREKEKKGRKGGGRGLE